MLALTSPTASAWVIDGSDYPYRQNVTLGLSSGNLPIGYQIRFIYLNDSNVGGNWTWADECIGGNTTRARITDLDDNLITNQTVLNCDVSGQRAEIAINLDSALDTTGQILRLYFGNDTATPEEHNSDVFPIYFDGFEDCDLSPWTEVSGAGIKEISTTIIRGGCSMMLLGVGNGSTSISAGLSSSDPDGKILSFDAYFNTSGLGVNAVTIQGDPSSSETVDNFGFSWSTGDSCMTSRWFDGTDNRGSTCYNDDLWMTIEARNIDFTAGTYDIWVNNSLETASVSTSTRNIWSGDIAFTDSADAGLASWFDNILIRDSDTDEQFVLPPVFGAEEFDEPIPPFPGFPHQDLPFTDDFSGNLSQWNVTQADYTIVDGYLKSSVGLTTEAFTNNSFNETDGIVLSYRTFGVDTHLTSELHLYVNSSESVNVRFTFGAGEESNSSKLQTRESDSTTTLYTDQNYTYGADGEWYNVKVFIDGIDIKFKVWNETDSEPNWRFEGTHGVPLEDGFRIRLFSTNLAAGEFVAFDDISLIHAGPETIPNVNLVPPTPENESNQTSDSIFINASNTLYNYNTCLLEWNGTNETMTVNGMYCFIDKTSLPPSNYTFRVYANVSGSTPMNVSETRIVSVIAPEPEVIVQFCPPEIVAMCEPFGEWTEASCSGDTLQLVKNCTLNWVENTTNYQCQIIKNEDRTCEYGCSETDGMCKIPPYYEAGIGIAIIFLVFLVARWVWVAKTRRGF